MGIKQHIASCIGSCGYLGYSPVMPGTLGSIGGAVASYYLITSELSYIFLGLYLLTLTLIGCWATGQLLTQTDQTDPRFIVIDEWVGVSFLFIVLYWIKNLLFPPLITETVADSVRTVTISFGQAGMPAEGFRNLLILAFVLFRFFDITKIGGLKKLERYPGLWGVMLDDIGAAFYALSSSVFLMLLVL